MAKKSSKFVGGDDEAQALVVTKAEDADKGDQDEEEPEDQEAAEDEFLNWADTMDKRDEELGKQRKDAGEKDRITASHAAVAGRDDRDRVRQELAAAERELRKLRAAARGVEAAGLPKPRARDRQNALTALASTGVDITAPPYGDEDPTPLMERSDAYILGFARARMDDGEPEEDEPEDVEVEDADEANEETPEMPMRDRMRKALDDAESDEEAVKNVLSLIHES